MTSTEKNQVERVKDALFNAWEKELRPVYGNSEEIAEALESSIYQVTFRVLDMLCKPFEDILKSSEISDIMFDLRCIYNFLESVKTSLRELDH